MVIWSSYRRGNVHILSTAKQHKHTHSSVIFYLSNPLPVSAYCCQLHSESSQMQLIERQPGGSPHTGHQHPTGLDSWTAIKNTNQITYRIITWFGWLWATLEGLHQLAITQCHISQEPLKINNFWDGLYKGERDYMVLRFYNSLSSRKRASMLLRLQDGI